MINLLVTTPLTFVLTLPANPTETDIAINEAVSALRAEWVEAGQSATRRLWAVVTQCSDLQAIRDYIAAYSLPITILAAQNSHKTPVLDANGQPVLDANGEPVMELVVHDSTTKATLLNYMPDEVIYDPITLTEVNRVPATKITLPVWGGHEAFVV